MRFAVGLRLSALKSPTTKSGTGVSASGMCVYLVARTRESPLGPKAEDPPYAVWTLTSQWRDCCVPPSYRFFPLTGVFGVWAFHCFLLLSVVWSGLAPRLSCSYTALWIAMTQFGRCLKPASIKSLTLTVRGGGVCSVRCEECRSGLG